MTRAEMRNVGIWPEKIPFFMSETMQLPLFLAISNHALNNLKSALLKKCREHIRIWSIYASFPYFYITCKIIR